MFHCNQTHLCFRAGTTRGARVYILAYVDDVLLIGPSIAVYSVHKALAQTFELSHEAPVTQFLGIDVRRDRSVGSIVISQPRYCKAILERFGMTVCNPVRISFGLEMWG